MSSDAWYYLKAETRQGPVDLEALISALISEPDPQRVQVWREGMAEWAQAGQIRELAGRLPPPFLRAVTPPPIPPAVQAPAARRSPSTASGIADQVEVVATLYRQLVAAVGFQLLLGCGANVAAGAGNAAEAPGIALFSLAAYAGLLVLAVYVATRAYRLAGALDESAPLLWAIALFVPCAGIIALLALSSKANGWCQKHGVKVGLFGPTKESIEELRRRA